jgi:hypothetical protein
MSFKLGHSQRVVAGRLFVNHNVETLFNSMMVMPVKIAKTWISDDIRPNRSKERWLNAIATAVPIGHADAR